MVRDLDLLRVDTLKFSKTIFHKSCSWTYLRIFTSNNICHKFLIARFTLFSNYVPCLIILFLLTLNFILNLLNSFSSRVLLSSQLITMYDDEVAYLYYPWFCSKCLSSLSSDGQLRPSIFSLDSRINKINWKGLASDSRDNSVRSPSCDWTLAGTPARVTDLCSLFCSIIPYWLSGRFLSLNHMPRC